MTIYDTGNSISTASRSRRPSIFSRLFVLLMSCVAFECPLAIFATAADQPPVQVPPAQAELVGKGEELQRQQAAAEKPRERPRNKSRAAGGRAKPDDPASGDSAKLSPAETKIMGRIAAEIRDSLQLRKTLVVWLVENTAENASLAHSMADHIDRLMRDEKLAEPDQLQMAVLSYGSDVKLLTPQPISDPAELQRAVADLKEQPGKKTDKLLPFTAFSRAIEKFLPYRTQGYEVIFVVAGASSGDDLAQADDVIASLKRAAIPVFGLGPAVPFGEIARNKQQRSGNTSRQLASLEPERIQLALFDRQGTADLTDSGYGPYGLEHVCRQTGGAFYRLRSGGSGGWELDPDSGDVKSELLARYTPDYVSPSAYKQLLTENKCRQALHNAALLPPTSGLDFNVRTSFAKEKDEAALSKTITTAQRAAAERDQPLQQLYDAMTVGESDRANLTGQRWQVEYDLAMGLVLAAKARLDGYNTMLAVLKQGKTFANSKSNRWMLEPADEIAAASALDKMAKSSRIYLQRVVAEHKGTPWAAVAQRELQHPAGWKLVERADDTPASRQGKNEDR